MRVLVTGGSGFIGSHVLDALAANVALVLRGTPPLDQLEEAFQGGAVGAQAAYALSYQAVTDLAALDPARGLKALLEAHAREVTRLPVDDAAVLVDVDTPDDYARTRV